MAKKLSQGPAPVHQNNIAPPQAPSGNVHGASGLSIFSFKVQAAIVALLGFVFYFNTFSNEFALDDRPIIVTNEFVNQGFAGIPKILTSDAFASYLNQQNSGNALAGGRYRPLSIVTFAIEQQFLGLPAPVEAATNPKEPKSNFVTPEAAAKIVRDMHVRHVVNVLLYIFSVIVLLYFLRTIIFPGNYIIPFLAAVLFVIHPIHTEVVANVKSRDEIMSLLFICLTFIYAFRYYDGRKRPDLTKSLVCYFAALLSKEYGLAMVLLLPFSVYVFRKETIHKSLSFVLPYLIPLVLYGLMRISSVGHGTSDAPDDIMNIPYLYASASEKIASIISVLFDYFRLLVFPHPLSSDYSFNQIPYSDFSSPVFWISLLFYSGLVGALVYFIKRRHVMAFAIAFYLFNLALVGNILVDIGAPMGERLVYHSSVGFVIALAYLLYQLFSAIKPAKIGMALLALLAGGIIVCSGFKTISRNADWKNDRVLFLHDVTISPKSVLILSNAGSASLEYAEEEKDPQKKDKYFKDAIGFLQRAIAINPKFANGYQNMGVAYYKTGFTDRAVECWDSTKKYNPSHPLLPYVLSIASNYYYMEGIKHGKANEHAAAILSFQKAVHVNLTDGDIWYNLGYAHMLNKHYTEAAAAFERALLFHTKNQYARKYLNQCNLAVSGGNQAVTDTVLR
ncbi:MAG: tetratricopeptide repeat protein [Taibaiella sp.]|nr:tetratricopeptide repeat protein [Taibaiella sp.]